jgi:signal peptidase I
MSKAVHIGYTIITVIIAVALVIGSAWFSRTHMSSVSGDSMEPTLYSGDITFGSTSNDVSKGDTIVFKDTDHWKDGESLIIKKVVAVSGDTVTIDANGILIVNNIRVDSPSQTYDIACPIAPKTVKVPAGKVFVRGDNIKVSDDSRYQLCTGGKPFVPVSSIKINVTGYIPIGHIIHKITGASS